AALESREALHTRSTESRRRAGGRGIDRPRTGRDGTEREADCPMGVRIAECPATAALRGQPGRLQRSSMGGGYGHHDTGGEGVGLHVCPRKLLPARAALPARRERTRRVEVSQHEWL